MRLVRKTIRAGTIYCSCPSGIGVWQNVSFSRNKLGRKWHRKNESRKINVMSHPHFRHPQQQHKNGAL